jgi:HPr kinase/phosphorylase
LSWASPSDPGAAGPPDGKAGPLTLHATTVAVAGRGLLILGPSGSGKSGLALQLMALGASLVADDRTILSHGAKGGLVATCPPSIRGLIEARGMGLLRATPLDAVTLAAAVDLGQSEAQRLPSPARIAFLGRPLPLLRKIETAYFAAALLHYMKEGPAEP